MKGIASIAVCLAAALVVAGRSFAAGPEAHRCRDLPVTVERAVPADAASICQGAGAAIAFFRLQGLVIPASIRVMVREKMPREAGSTSVGAFSRAENIVFILPYRRFKRAELLNLPKTRDFYAGVAIHEVAHALGAFNSCVEHPTVEAVEYVAFVTMLSAMEPETRVHILELYEDSGGDRIRPLPSPVLHIFDPMGFGVSSYRHFLQLEDGPAFFKDVLAGKALAD